MLPLTARNVLLAALMKRETSLWEMPDNPFDAAPWYQDAYLGAIRTVQSWSNPLLPPELRYPGPRYHEIFVPEGEPFEFGKDFFVGAPSPWGKDEVPGVNEVIFDAIRECGDLTMTAKRWLSSDL